MNLTPDLALALWRRALDSEIGIRIETTEKDKVLARDMLYKAKQQANQLALDAIIMVMPGPHPTELWLCKKATELDAIP